jgi:hypothetical protein
LQVPNIKLHGNLSNESQRDTSGHTGEHKEKWRLCDCAKAHKKSQVTAEEEYLKITILVAHESTG